MSDIKTRIARLEGKVSQIKKDIKTETRVLQELQELAIAIEQAQTLLQVTAQETQDALRVHIEDVVQVALDTCFPDEYTFHTRFELKRGSTICEMYVKDDSGFEMNPMSASGGGLVDIISFGLRIAIWSLSNPDNFIVLDEPFKFLSEGLRPVAGELVKSLSTKLDIQIIMVTHDKAMMDIADKSFLVKKNKKGRSIITTI